MKLPVEPLNGMFFVKPIEVDDRTTDGGVFLPATVGKNDPVKAQVVATSKGTLLKNGKFVPMSVKVGDFVLLHQGSGNWIKFGGEDYLALRENDVFGVFTPEQ